MSAGDAVSYAIGEAIMFIVSKVTGKTFNLEPNKAQRIGELVIFSVLIGAIVIIAFMYS